MAAHGEGVHQHMNKLSTPLTSAHRAQNMHAVESKDELYYKFIFFSRSVSSERLYRYWI